MILMIDTTKGHIGKQITDELGQSSGALGGVELIDTSGLKISHCLGCNCCWLKTPGQCVIKDDYEPVLRVMLQADQVWLVTDTVFGFVTHQTKNIVDRVMPLVTMYLHFKGKQMRHVMRYDHNPDFGILYTGEGDRKYLTRWCKRVALNFGTKSRGVFPIQQWKEAIACMY